MLFHRRAICKFCLRLAEADILTMSKFPQELYKSRKWQPQNRIGISKSVKCSPHKNKRAECSLANYDQQGTNNKRERIKNSNKNSAAKYYCGSLPTRYQQSPVCSHWKNQKLGNTLRYIKKAPRALRGKKSRQKFGMTSFRLFVVDHVSQQKGKVSHDTSESVFHSLSFSSFSSSMSMGWTSKSLASSPSSISSSSLMSLLPPPFISIVSSMSMSGSGTVSGDPSFGEPSIGEPPFVDPPLVDSTETGNRASGRKVTAEAVAVFAA